MISPGTIYVSWLRDSLQLGGTPLTPELVLCIRMCPDKCLKEGLKYFKK